jgi:hypothetical protein
MNFNIYNCYSLAMSLLGFDREISRFIDEVVPDRLDVKETLDVAVLKSSSYARKGLNLYHGAHGGGREIVRGTSFVTGISSRIF